ncbi:TIGR00266 family protein [Halapricum sp. CBA1109]|uniref:TIGR00266 family protein n=1 Tax=Halapricum sp. CBA1109 TaxID=2668068 RepID=UPI0012FC4469|nr:TIGR00266 family protein [Halapricum sp. CBA1109]MUV89431.1 TIGR00266 family protein [Halapricum sp. CBA1109]
MEFSIEERPSYAMVDVTLGEGEQIETKPGVMMTRDDSVTVESSVGGDGGIGSTVKRAVSDEQTLVDNTYTATREGGSVTLVPEHPGDVIAVSMGDRQSMKVQSGSLIAWEPLVERSTEMNNFSNMFSSGELTVLGLSGQGVAFLSAFGSMVEREVTSEDPLVVDEDHLVAWDPSLSLSRKSDGGLKSSILGGEGRVTEFRGDGHVWLQTRNPMLFSTGTAHEDDETSGGVGVDDFI